MACGTASTRSIRTIRSISHHYSVLCRFIGSHVCGLIHAHTVEIFFREERIAAHKRSTAAGGSTTELAHMPNHHRVRATWSPAYAVQQAHEVGPHTGALIARIVAQTAVEEACYRRCHAIVRLADAYGTEALERACDRALKQQTLSAGAVREIIKANGAAQVPLPIDHENIRGADYYCSNSSS